MIDDNNVYESQHTVQIVQKNNNNKTQKKQQCVRKRRQTVDVVDSNAIKSLELSKQRIVVDYNLLAFIENINIEDDESMRSRMREFIDNLKNNYKCVEYTEYENNDKLFCIIDMIYFLPILLKKFENREILETLEDILKVINSLSLERKNKKPKLNRQSDNRYIHLYSIGKDFYLMCRKKQNLIDGKKNIEKKYGETRLLKTWDDNTNFKYLIKSIVKEFPDMKWNARTNILLNSRDNEISEEDLLNFINDLKINE